MTVFRTDLVRTLANPGVLLVLGALVVVGAAPAYLFGTGDLAVASEISWGYGENASGFPLIAYAYNGVGNPVSGAVVQLIASVTIPNPFGPPTVEYSANASTDMRGLAEFLLPPSSTGYALVSLQTVASNGAVAVATGSIGPLGIGTPGAGSGNIVVVGHGLLPSREALQLMLVGASGGQPPAYHVEWAPSPTPAAPPAAAFAPLGILSGFVTSFDLPTPTNTSADPYVSVRVLDPNGSVVLSGAVPSVPPSANSPGASVYYSLSLLVGAFAPLLGIFAAYTAYGRERLGGYFQNLLVQPVTRLGLLARRYLAISVLLLMGVGLLVGLMQLLLWATSGVAFDWSTAGPFFGGLLVVTFAFAGFTFLLAHLLRTARQLLAVLAALYLILGLLLLVFPTGEALSPAAGNPAQYLLLVTTWVLASLGASNVVGTWVPPEWFGAWLLATIGVAWVVVPPLLAGVLARNRD